jgi:hypothetical protein
MELVIPLIILAIACLALGIALTRRPRRTKASDPADTALREYSYALRGALLTPAEVRFYHALKEAVGEEFVIFSKVRVADILTPQAGLGQGDWQRAFNKISAKHFDFVLCDP